MQLVKIINLNEILKTIIDNISEVDIVTKFNFLGVMKKAEPYIQNFESVRSSLIEKYGEKKQLLHSYQVVFPKLDDFPDISEKSFNTPYPVNFTKYFKEN